MKTVGKNFYEKGIKLPKLWHKCIERRSDYG